MGVLIKRALPSLLVCVYIGTPDFWKLSVLLAVELLKAFRLGRALRYTDSNTSMCMDSVIRSGIAQFSTASTVRRW